MVRKKKNIKKKVVKHLRGDIEGFKKEMKEDEKLIKTIKNKPKPRAKGPKKIKRVIGKYKEGELYTDPKKDPIDKSRKKAIEIVVPKAGTARKKKKKD